MMTPGNGFCNCPILPGVISFCDCSSYGSHIKFLGTARRSANTSAVPLKVRWILVEQELFNIWLNVRVEVRHRNETFVLFDPQVGYRDLARFFEAQDNDLSEQLLYVVTAWNPGGIFRDSFANRVSEAQLILLLVNAGVDYFVSVGSSGEWMEPGTAFFDSDPELARTVALLFRQLGYYIFGPLDGYCVDVTNTIEPRILVGPANI